MALATHFVVNELVKYRDMDCIILDIIRPDTNSAIGWPTYILLDIVFNQQYRCCKHELHKNVLQSIDFDDSADLFEEMETALYSATSPSPTPIATTDTTATGGHSSMSGMNIKTEMYSTTTIATDTATPTTSTRHNNLTAVDLDSMASANLEKTTSYATKWAVKLLKDWLVERGYSPDFEELDALDLAILLRSFYGEVNNKNSGAYSRSSVIGIRAGINRYLQHPLYNRTINITTDKEFMSCNKVLTGRIKINREKGLDVTKHKSAIAPGDIDKMYESGVLSNESPQALQYKVFFELSLQFGRRGREGLHSLRKSSFIVLKDDVDQNVEYVTLAYNEKSKKNQGLDGKRRECDDRMYSHIDDEKCPVKSFKLYLSKLSPSVDSFYQKPRTHADVLNSPTWYCRPIGVNTLSSFMKQISVKAGLSKTYTNHCIRATTSTVLSHANINTNDIIAVTGHKDPKSLLPYVNSTSNAQRKNMSEILHCYGKQSNGKENQVVPTEVSPSENIHVVSNNQVPRLITSASGRDIAVDQMVPSVSPSASGEPLTSVSQSHLSVAQEMAMKVFHGNTITGGNFTINLQLKM